ncbi:BtrH N-terminal domain-containing protein [Gordonia sp. (in: high G+C Gram-positive bacteria)]|uniref:BtrH N-terminal domain-containing protein n=1 Tax=Gordonia sp. (in: high G+C Gram-positive bacteria) TaxID=84139 RepID=UPI0025BAADA0|nr:BtrH N-terminal domain-containing protein [Gordonia sp. (in: high G+C Gram-positive bacteria)]
MARQRVGGLTDESASDASTPPGARIVGGVASTGGMHCETTALGVLLSHAGLDLSESMLFGLGGGLSFIYWDSKQQELPFLGGRVKPFVLTQNLTRRLGVELRALETTSPRKAWEQVRSSIDDGSPVGLQLDSHDLEYFGSPVHFAGHVVAMYGYDAERAYLVDTAQQGGAVSTSLASLARARAARGPMSARHRSFTMMVEAANMDAGQHIPALIPAITACAEDFLSPPIANLGGRGIRTAARRVPSWFTRVDRPDRDLPVIATLMERAGTGGALFRNLYRDFLTECHGLLDGEPSADVVEQARDRFAESALLWTRVAGLIEQAGVVGESAHLVEASQLLEHIATIEISAMTALSTLTAADPDHSPRRT